MMDKSYILEHNILEQYLLGELSRADEQKIEELILKDADLKEQLNSLESNFELMALENAITPPEKVKDSLMKVVRGSNLKGNSVAKKNSLKTYLGIAATLAALFMITSLYILKQLSDTRNQLKLVDTENSVLIENIENLNTSAEHTSKLLALLKSPETEQYILKGNELAPGAKIVTYVNHKEKSIIVNAKDLPKLDENHDYQMWADVEGVMIDMGVIAKESDLLAMNYIDKATSLNITIEPAGGNDHPTVSRLVSNVYLR
ncbi:anti-sigma factor [Leeuwenhoekiella sp. MAR_2009_132]|uniref:anti-sigma factor n=1 Tax=Leeuwenhoekiella sp. MAR_2009_132 TaxID=1392489 RepID=UPI0009E02832|nr:anti-sigma factor [Leeuwenhoekiella sp. MAR_2009_132]